MPNKAVDISNIRVPRAVYCALKAAAAMQYRTVPQFLTAWAKEKYPDFFPKQPVTPKIGSPEWEKEQVEIGRREQEAWDKWSKTPEGQAALEAARPEKPKKAGN